MQTYGADQFIGQITDVANAVLPYIGAAVAAGLVVFVLVWGIRKGIRTVRDIADRRADEAYDRQRWQDDFDEPSYGL